MAVATDCLRVARKLDERAPSSSGARSPFAILRLAISPGHGSAVRAQQESGHIPSACFNLDWPILIIKRRAPQSSVFGLASPPRFGATLTSSSIRCLFPPSNVCAESIHFAVRCPRGARHRLRLSCYASRQRLWLNSTTNQIIPLAVGPKRAFMRACSRTAGQRHPRRVFDSCRHG